MRDERGGDRGRDAAGAERRATEQLDRVAELRREGDVVAVERVDALVRDLVDAHVRVERDRREDRDLGGRIRAVHVLRRVGLRVSELLGARERLGVGLALARHRRQDEVRRPVDDADDLAHARGEHRLAQHLDDRDGGAHRCLEAELRAVTLGDAPQLLAVAGEQLLVRRDDRDPAAQELRDVRARGVDAAHDLGDDRDAGVVAQLLEALGQEALRRRPAARPARVAHERAHHRDGTADDASDVFGARSQQRVDRAADGAVSEQPDADRVSSFAGFEHGA